MRQDVTTLFQERLAALGFSTYVAYLRSPHWQAMKAAYRANDKLPQYCLACKNPQFELHHRSYARIGHEWIGDLIPLCRICHEKVHTYLHEHHKPLEATHVALRKILGIGKSAIKKRFRPFSRKRPRKRYTMAFKREPLCHRN